MDYDAILEQVIALLQGEKRLSYRVLKRRLQLNDDLLEDLKEDLIYAKHLAVDEDGKVLVWVAGAAPQTDQTLPAASAPSDPRAPEAERRQLTVLFCDLVDSTVLASQLDPEEWREVVRAYQATCAAVIQRFEGHIAQLLGDGLLVYFGYPLAHEDDAQRAIRTGLGIIEAMGKLNARLEQDQRIRLTVRVGMHTGLVVVGEMGSQGRHEQLALGETPNVAAWIQGMAGPNTVVISAATYRLVQGYFACQDLGLHTLKGIATPVPIYGVVGESLAQSSLDVAASRGLTPLVGREQEMGLLLDRWAQAKEGLGQVVLLSGEAGIGKSRLVQVLKERVAGQPHVRWECRCSPYYQHSPLYPVIDLFQRALQWQRDDSPREKLGKLERTLAAYDVSLPDVVPLFASLLSVPLSDRYLPLTLTPERQRQNTLEAVLAVLLAVAAQQPVLFIVEDLHWADPSTLELLSLFINQGPTARILTLLVFRPEFCPPWSFRAHLSHITLARLPRHQADVMIERVVRSKRLPEEVHQQVVAKADGVPLFVEELTKTVLESGLLTDQEDHYELAGPLPPLAIPATLQDSLMARLDRLSTVKEVAQLGATMGRAFSYELLRAVSPVDEATLQHALARLVEAELLYQRGVPPQATYLFKHALIQDAAYQSLLRSTRQHYHRQIAQVLEAHFPEIAETQPELLAHHFSEAGLSEHAVNYWHKAGERAVVRSANVEAISHLTKGVEVLQTLPDTLKRTEKELAVQTALGSALMALKGQGAPEVEHVYTRARQLCQRVGDTPQLSWVLIGLWRFYNARGEFQTAQALGEQLLTLAQRLQDSVLFLQAHWALGATLTLRGEMISARQHLEEGIAVYDPQQHRALALRSASDPGMACLAYLSWILWCLGYPDQALARSHEALARAEELSNPYSLAAAHAMAAALHIFRREGNTARERAETAIALSREKGFEYLLAWGMVLRGGALIVQEQGEQSIAQLREGLAAYQTTGVMVLTPFFLAQLAEAYGVTGQVEAGLSALAEAIEVVDKRGWRFLEAELHRLNGELFVQEGTKPKVRLAEENLFQALDVARHQEAKSLELRAAMSLSRLWQQQGKRAAARQLLAEIYGWFTEGFDTADLQEAKALLEELS